MSEWMFSRRRKNALKLTTKAYKNRYTAKTSITQNGIPNIKTLTSAYMEPVEPFCQTCKEREVLPGTHFPGVEDDGLSLSDTSVRLSSIRRSIERER